MQRMQGAILAAITGLVGLAGLGPLQGPLPEPLPVRFKLADGVQVAGMMTAWDVAGFDGSFGRREWVDLVANDAWKLYRRVMDDQDAGHWVDLGGVMLLMDGGESWAEQAFTRALRLDKTVADRIDAARHRADEVRRQREELQRAIEAERLNTRSPEAGPWRADVWPVLTIDEQQAARSAMANESQQIARDSTLPLSPIETDYFLFYSDMPRLQAARWALMLDKTYDEISKLVGLREDQNIFWGKAAVLVFKDQDRFRLVEAETFGQLVPLKVTGMCHPVGPKVFISCYRAADDDELAATLVRETVHGYLHRFGTPKRLPAWANEGLAEYLVAASVKADQVDDALRREALQFIRSGGNVQAVLDLNYADDTWPGPNEIGRAVGFLLIELMIRENRAGFSAWVRAVKRGDDWEEALRNRYGVARSRLVNTFVQYYMVND